MPVGSVGELVIEGPTVARGYLNDEIKTAKAFIENLAWVASIASDHTGFNASRMYKSGDLVRYNSDGSVSYIGRKDTQIKLNGQRIELGEIEFHVGKNFPEHAQSAVELVAPSNRGSAKALAVFFSLVQDEPAEAIEVIQPVSTGLPTEEELLLPMSDDLRDMCKSNENGLAGDLPSYMIPAIFIPIKKMPWTSPSGSKPQQRGNGAISTHEHDEQEAANQRDGEEASQDRVLSIEPISFGCGYRR
jgi:acyl-CoA synthetase (AMP-forming)/AMP-acid ligase II